MYKDSQKPFRSVWFLKFKTIPQNNFHDPLTKYILSSCSHYTCPSNGVQRLLCPAESTLTLLLCISFHAHFELIKMAIKDFGYDPSLLVSRPAEHCIHPQDYLGSYAPL